MSELERFMRDVEADEDLAKRFGTVANRIALANKNLSEAEVKSRAANELGYKVTATDLEIYAADNEHLDHEELEQVAGGVPRAPKPTECTSRYARGEIPHCWDKSSGCYTFFYNA